jgi:hypothetical protein
MTRQELLARWPPNRSLPHETTLWRWLSRAHGLGLMTVTGTGTKREPFRFGLRKGVAGTDGHVGSTEIGPTKDSVQL